ncbi:MAG: hypothetical protein HC927_05705, partial [Deltaproteobacteria bacterium]|nr:hypothetical protein [Deltaproteobacteria bacterium]
MRDQLLADEGPIYPEPIERLPYEPEPDEEEQEHSEVEPAKAPLTGWEFVELLRDESRSKQLKTPPPLRTLFKTILRDDLLEFDYDPVNDSQRMTISTDGVLRVVPRHSASQEEWLFCTWHLLFHLGLGHLQPPPQHRDSPEAEERWARACELTINRHVLMATRIALPYGFVAKTDKNPNLTGRFAPFLPRYDFGSIPTPEQYLARWAEEGEPDHGEWRSPAGHLTWDVVGEPNEQSRYFRTVFTYSQIKAMDVKEADRSARYAQTHIASAHRWFMESFPLLSAAAAEFNIDYERAEALGITVAAVNARQQIIYVNVNADLTELEWRFVIGHEILHVVLEHYQRLGERDPFVWNLACDYVINNWLVQMGVGVCPPKGGLYKKEYAGLDAETIYNQLMENDGNDQLKLESFRGEGVGDILDLDPDFEPGSDPRPGRARFGRTRVRQVTQEAARKMLEEGGQEEGGGRGLVPGDLLEALDVHAPGEPLAIPEWKADLGRWFQVMFKPKPPQRSYMRMSRRQAAAPHIPRPGKAVTDYESPTFGVVLDTSGSMSQELLQKGIAALVAYAELHGVAQVRLVMCDARPYDEGFIPVAKLKKPYRIAGRGGTALQPAVRLLEEDKQFPPDAPILVITDGACDALTIMREHAFLLPGNGKLPF